MKTKIFIIASIFAVAFTSCTEDKMQEDVQILEDITPQELSIQLDSLQENMIVAWDTMITQDDIKMSSIKRMIQELSFIDGSKKDSITKLDSLYESAKANRYTRDNLTSDKIDEYDDVQASLIGRITDYARIIPLIEKYPMVEELKADIASMDGQVVFMRSGYDNFALEYNRLLKTYPITLAKLQPKYSTLTSVGVFTIIEEEAEKPAEQPAT